MRKYRTTGRYICCSGSVYIVNLPMKGIDRCQALYKLNTRRRASSRSTDSIGRTCWMIRFAGSLAAMTNSFNFTVQSFYFCFIFNFLSGRNKGWSKCYVTISIRPVSGLQKVAELSIKNNKLYKNSTDNEKNYF